MLSPDNVAELEKLAKEDGYTYILSQSVRTGYDSFLPYLSRKDTTWIKLTEALYFTKTEEGLVLCYNPFTALKAKQTREEKIKRLTTFIAAEMAKETKPKRAQSKSIIHDRIIKKLHSSHASRYFNVKDTFKKREEVIEKEELLDGVWALTGNTSLAPEEIVKTYKQEAEIESSFRVIKDVIELRPIYHYNPQRVKAHVFICVLSYLVARLLERKTGLSVKMLKEKYMTSVIINGDTPTSPKQIIGGSIDF
jgi:transposase